MLTACVTSSEHNALQAQVNQINRQVSSSQTNQADSWSQLMELRQEVSELRGQIDTLNYALQRAGGAQKMADTLAAHDRALHLLESQMALDLQLGGDPNAQAPVFPEPTARRPAWFPACRRLLPPPRLPPWRRPLPPLRSSRMWTWRRHCTTTA